MPRLSLRTVLFKVQEEECVSEVFHLRSIVRHAVGESREVACLVIVAVLVLVVAGFGAKVLGTPSLDTAPLLMCDTVVVCMFL